MDRARQQEIELARFLYNMDGREIAAGVVGYGATYNLKSLEKLRKKAIKENYMRESDAQESLSTLKVPELKEILREHSLPVSGRKKELIERIADNISTDNYPPKRPFYVITASGKEIIERNEIYTAPYLSMFLLNVIENEINAIEKEGETPTAELVYLRFCEQEEKHLIDNGAWSCVRDINNSISSFYDETNDAENALKYKFRYIYVKLSGICDGREIQSVSLSSLSAWDLRELERLMLCTDYTSEQLKAAFIEAVTPLEKIIPFHYFTTDQCFDIIEVGLQSGEARGEDFEEFARKPDPHSTTYFYEDIDLALGLKDDELDDDFDEDYLSRRRAQLQANKEANQGCLGCGLTTFIILSIIIALVS